MMKNKELIKKVKKFEYEAALHHQRLDEESVWFFLGVLGTWSVSSDGLKLIASAILCFFLWTRVFKDIDFSKSYSKQIKELTQFIDTSSLKKNKKLQLKGRIHTTRSQYIDWIPFFKTNYRFILSASFFAYSVAEFWFRFKGLL
ncbi:hypothetical protein [Vibrio sp. MEBiC08052]|uniref:hypothetical protein n=1 Tax=Vibrio sp. MEBiC08052 TaxID=1761910 RepID=UPI0007405F60|nr:hypothetical protein [Vibrio sp. MEBiC08052]KUI99639.1 hypothetical protein VRK_10850 [Vibrio sp. MEBiC08052]